jgi:phage terminase large subunit-like protein
MNDSLPNDEYYFDEERANLICEFFPEMLVHVKGEWGGQPIVLEEWQKEDIIKPLFGWKKKSDNTRRYRTGYIEIPRKNSKSTMCSGIGAAVLFCDDEPGAEIYSAATDKEQARITFKAAKDMILASPILSKKCKIFKDAIEYKGRVWRPLSADAKTKDGLNAHLVIVDELHAHKNRELIDVLETSQGARRQPILLIITTAGLYDKTHICWEYHEHAEQVRDGIVSDPEFLPVIYSANKTDDWKSLETAKKANPNFGISVKEDYVKQKLKKAIDIPGFENTYKRLHLNLWTEQAKKWLSIESWDACKRIYTPQDLIGRRCFGGLDMSSTQDLSALGLVFPFEKGERFLDYEFSDRHYVTLQYFWVPKDSAEKRSRNDKVKYLEWIRQGYITATEGNVVDYDFVRADINKIGDLFNIKELAIDRWNTTQLQTQLMGDGFTVVPFGQGFASMSAPTKDFETLVLGQKLWHNGHLVMRFCVDNIAIKSDPAENIKPDKSTSGEKIDGVVATIMGLGRAAVEEPESSPLIEVW